MSINATSVTAAAVPGISSAMQELCEAENRLCQVMQALDARLVPVLVFELPEEAVEQEKQAAVSPLAQAISNHAHTMRGLARDVESLLSRLDT